MHEESKNNDMNQDEIRKENQQLFAEIEEQTRQYQRECSHRRLDGTVRCVFVHDDGAGYLLCQKCRAIIRPGTAPDGYTGRDIYDTQLFNGLHDDIPGFCERSEPKPKRSLLHRLSLCWFGLREMPGTFPSRLRLCLRLLRPPKLMEIPDELYEMSLEELKAHANYQLGRQSR